MKDNGFLDNPKNFWTRRTLKKRKGRCFTEMEWSIVSAPDCTTAFTKTSDWLRQPQTEVFVMFILKNGFQVCRATSLNSLLHRLSQTRARVSAGEPEKHAQVEKRDARPIQTKWRTLSNLMRD